MCGIAGQVALRPDRQADIDDVRRLVSSLRHRGPDDEGLWADPARRVALGMRRLAIIDLITGDQPVFNEDRSIVCVFNGEIYNFQTLRLELERKGHSFRSMTDSEVIVHLYEEEGVGCLKRLRGMFALAIWDQRTGCLVLARDRLGKKPLYYAEVDGRLAFASEITALYRLPEYRREIDPAALDLYLTYSYIPAPYSIHRAIRKLPPAHFMVIHDGRLETSRYWRLEMSPPWDASADELTQALQAKLAEAVQIRMTSDVPLGCFLSGGTDSSAVVSLMSDFSSKPVKTFSIGFTHDAFNELPYARVVATQYRTEHFEYLVDPEATTVLPELVRHFGEPYGDSSALPTWHLSRLARQHVTVALNGDGGDELFAGYPWYRTGLLLDGLAGPFAWAGPALSRVPGGLGGRIRRLGARLSMPPAHRFASLRRFLDEDAKLRLYSSSFLAASGTAAKNYLAHHYEATSGDSLARMQCTDIMTYLPEELLVKVDRMTMAHSLEGRSPLLDHELVEFCARIPTELKVGAEGGKLIFRRAIRDRFPHGFLERRKMGFSIPLAEWLRGELRAECRRRICGSVLMDQGWFERHTVRRMLDEHVAEARDWGPQLWNLLMLAHWVEIFGT